MALYPLFTFFEGSRVGRSIGELRCRLNSAVRALAQGRRPSQAGRLKAEPSRALYTWVGRLGLAQGPARGHLTNQAGGLSQCLGSAINNWQPPKS